MKIKIPKRRYNAKISCNISIKPSQQRNYSLKKNQADYTKPGPIGSQILDKGSNFILFQEVNNPLFKIGHQALQHDNSNQKQCDEVRELNYSIHEPNNNNIVQSHIHFEATRTSFLKAKKIKKNVICQSNNNRNDLLNRNTRSTINLNNIPEFKNKRTENDNNDLPDDFEFIKPDVIQIQNGKTIIDNGNECKCNCKKSFCLRLHCACFKEMKTCGISCTCVNCKNNLANDIDRQYVIKKTIEINPMAFKPKIKSLGETQINVRGCKCTKNRCIKKYCECYKNGTACTELCKCINCKNNKIRGGKDIQKLHEKGYRKKHRLVLSNGEGEKIGLGIKFVKHKKRRKAKQSKK